MLFWSPAQVLTLDISVDHSFPYPTLPAFTGAEKVRSSGVSRRSRARGTWPAGSAWAGGFFFLWKNADSGQMCGSLSVVWYNIRSQGSADAKGRRVMDSYGSLLDKIHLPELRLPLSRSSSREPRFVDRSPRKWTAAPSGECRAGNPWFRRHPIRSHCFSHSTSRSATKIRCPGLFAANKEPPCQDSLKFELWMKKYETSIGSIEIHRLSRLKMRKRMKLVRMNTHEYETSAASANDFIPSSGMEGSAGWEGAWV